MLTLEALAPGPSLVGIKPAPVVTIVAAAVGDGAVQAICETADGAYKERADEPIATVERPWSFDGDGANFKLAVEAKRIDLTWE